MMMAMEHLYYFPMKCRSVFFLVLLHLLLLHSCSCSSSQGLLNSATNFTNILHAYYNTCSTDKFGANTPYQANLLTLLSYLSSNATPPTAEFYNTTVASQDDPTSTVYGLFLCRGDISHQQCLDCVSNATRLVTSYCPLAKQAIVRQFPCFIRYSNINFFSRLDEQPQIFASNEKRISDDEAGFAWTLANTLNQVATEASSCGPAGTKKFATREAQVPEGGRTMFTMAQCTPDLSAEDCGKCLTDMIKDIARCCLGRTGGRFLSPSCSVRFELYQFYWHVTPCAPHRSLGSSVSKEKGKDLSRTIILIVVFSSVSGILLFYVSYYFFRKKARRNHKTILKKSFGDESATLEPLQFELAVIRAATNNFSPENRIGKGGFGEVYKGILHNGQQIAVKILSKCSKQGEVEFKNEVLLIAKLQHKNLVAFIGFCLEEQEKILIYEYVPNKSLDYFLFEVERQKLLQWSDRYNIIGGIARGILYLHEYSRLKVIHRDLKPSNVLLDENMVPKISDFGLARIVEINQEQERTKRIVGTHGYMSPEYAMLGNFSEKSDVYSFGVMVLDIITGKRNVYSSKAQNPDDLPSYVWRYWRDGAPLSIVDENIKENYSKAEVIKCIQIGLLCAQHDPDDRPTMTSVISYLTNDSIELPTPHEPAFFLSKRIDPKSVPEEESSSGRSGNTPTPSSTNEMSVSTFLPR